MGGLLSKQTCRHSCCGAGQGGMLAEGSNMPCCLDGCAPGATRWHCQGYWGLTLWGLCLSSAWHCWCALLLQ